MTAPSGREDVPVLTHGNVRLREVTTADAGALTALFARPEVSIHLSPPPGDVVAFTEWLETSLRRRHEGRAFVYALLDTADTNRVAGLFMVLRTTQDDAEAEIGFAMAPHLWGTGVFMTAATLYVTWLFARWPIHRLVGKTLARNHRGLGAMRKLGATIVEQRLRGDEAEFVWAIGRDAWAHRQPRSG